MDNPIRDLRRKLSRPWISILSILMLACAGQKVLAGDWPQILGPQRNGAAMGESLAESWPKTGPPRNWERAVGTGNAGVAIVGETGVLFHRRGNQEVVEAFDVSNGETRWKHASPTSFVPQVGNDDGPLCVPTIHNGSVITFGAQGVLTCCDLATGEQRWQRRTHEEFEALEGYFGAGSTPLILDDRVIVNVGGHKTDAGVVAFALDDGRTLWQATNERASYSAPISIVLDQQPMIVCVTRLKCLGLDPASGVVRFELPFGQSGPTVNAAVPVVIGDNVFLTASYGIGAVLARLTPTSAHELWRRRDVLSSQYTTPILSGDHVYGIDGREDGPPADFKCIDPRTGRTLWTEQRFGYATLIRSGDLLIVATTEGELLLVRATPQAFQPLSRFRLTTSSIRALPALAQGCLFVRDSEKLYCLDVSAKTSPSP